MEEISVHDFPPFLNFISGSGRMNLGRIYYILKKDIHESLKNRVILIVILLPIIVSVIFSFLNSPDHMEKFKIGITGTNSDKIYDLIDKEKDLTAIIYQDYQKGQVTIRKGNIDALLEIEHQKDSPHNFRLYFKDSNPVNSILLQKKIEEIIGRYLMIESPYNIQVITQNSSGISKSLIPVWITVTMIMIGVLVVSGNFAEERDNGTLEAIILSPAGRLEFLMGKGLFGIIISSSTIVLMCLLNRVYPGNLLNLFVFLAALFIATFIFTSIGLLIGLYTDSQSAARSTGTVIYFPLLFPLIFSRSSGLPGYLARLVPTHYFFHIVEKVLVYDISIKEIITNMIALLSFAIIMSLLIWNKFKRGSR